MKLLRPSKCFCANFQIQNANHKGFQMNGDKSRASDERWQILRALYEKHGLDLEQISVVSGIGLPEIIERSCDGVWQSGKRNRSSSRSRTAPKTLSQDDLRLANARTAKQILNFLKRMLKKQTGFNASEENEGNAQTKTRNVLAIAKGVLTIEEMIANLEKITDAGSLHPQDTLEFHNALEKQIANLANGGAKTGVSEQTKPA
ncbi:MAG: hypothetical protein WBC71_13425 [Salaquimonas sp.]